MGRVSVQPLRTKLWELARKQHGVVARRQLVPLGLSEDAVDAAVRFGRLHRTGWRGVYAVGRPELSELSSRSAR